MNSEIYKTLGPEQKAFFDLLIDIRREIKRMADLLETEIERSEP
jgi:hypothetical protein